MLHLTMDLRESAKILGVRPNDLVSYARQENINGVFKINGDWRVSIFTLAHLLNTTPHDLLDVLDTQQRARSTVAEGWLEGEY